MCELTKKLLDLKKWIFEAKQCASTHHKSDNSEWKYCTYKLLLGSINFHKILEQLQTMRSEGWHTASSVPNLDITSTTWSLRLVNPWTINATLPTAMYYLHPCTFFRYRFDVFWKPYIVESRMLFRKHEKWGSNYVNLLQNVKSMWTFKTLPSCAQVSENFAGILPAQIWTHM
jgi:hypothetical protein